MAVEVRLFGFGDVKPSGFGDANHANVNLPTPLRPNDLLARLGLTDPTGLVLMRGDELVTPARWHEPLIADRDVVTLMWAIEGG